MVVTQLQLKWPNHSTHLLSGLKYLYKNAQLVDCTLKCNKHTLKVHRAVLAACSPYFERELENNPLIVIKDMQFNVLQALIEFMYYGETRITEENLTSLIEAAKLFEIKGLSEMDLLTSNDNGVISSTIAKNKNCTVESSCISDNIDDMVFDNNSQLINSIYKSKIQEAIPNCVAENCIHDSEDSNSNPIADTASTEPHSARNFVITPPQTESAQILLSLARSYSQNQYLNLQSADDVLPNGDLLHARPVVDHSINNDVIFNEHGLLMTTTTATTTDVTTSSSSSDSENLKSMPCVVLPQSHTKQSLPQLQHKDELNSDSLLSKYSLAEKYNGDVFASSTSTPPPPLARVDNNRPSLLAKLLTQGIESDSAKCYKSLYNEKEAGERCAANNQNTDADAVAVALDKTKNADLQPGIILEYPFLIETNDGSYVSVDNMLNVFESGEIFDPSGDRPLKIIPKDEVGPSMVSCGVPPPSADEIDSYSEEVLQRIKEDTEDELKDDPEAVVLSRLTEDGRLEKYVLSSADIRALREMNERREKQSRRPEAAEVPHIDVESPLSRDGDAPPLITRILDCGARVENAISRLPFRKSVCGDQASDARSESDRVSVPSTATSTSAAVASEHILEDAALTVDDAHHHHHHENMFEELDSQFNMDCSLENIQREYAPYEEASKNETQLEHNYYANAMKDEDEECVVINENYGLRAMLMIGEPLENGVDVEEALIALPSTAGGPRKRKCADTFEVISAADVYLNGRENETKDPRRNGLADKAATVFNGKRDLILNADELASSASNATPPATKMARTTNGASKNFKKVKSKEALGAIDKVNTLPFKSVKSSSSARTQCPKKPKRTYRRRSSASTLYGDPAQRDENSSINGILYDEDNLVEEIIIDEIS